MTRFQNLSAVLLCAVPLVAHAGLSERQVRLLHNICVPCHANADSGAPRMGKSDVWNDRTGNGETALLRNVVQGLRGMPPLGSCSACDEADLRALTRVLAGLERGE